MKRALVSLAIVGALLAAAVTCEHRLGEFPREDPLGKELLYLPTPEMLKVLSVGNSGLMADVLYLWSIQYYSLFTPHERFLYLETVYNLITDLDPRYFDAYRMGALIMQIQTVGDQTELQRAVQRIFDKGLRNLPDSWALGEAAAWDMFMRFKDRSAALHYAELAVAMPGAPPRIRRMVGVWRDAENVWTAEDSIRYWSQAVEEATDPMDRHVSQSKLFDAVVARDRQQLEPRLRAFADRYGRCPRQWRELVEAGLIAGIPTELFRNP